MGMTHDVDTAQFDAGDAGSRLLHDLMDPLERRLVADHHLRKVANEWPWHGPWRERRGAPALPPPRPVGFNEAQEHHY